MTGPNKHEVNRGRPYVGHLPRGIYDLLPFLPAGLMVDAGAAIGGITRHIRLASPKSRVLAFEPFPGNHPYFERKNAGDDQVTFYKCAVGAQTGRMQFETGSTVRSPKRRKETPGASFVGKLAPDGPGEGRNAIEVDVLALDDVCDAQVRFLKMDLQGGELDALKGAAGLFSRNAIDILYVEHAREPEVLQALDTLGLYIFDSEYTIMLKGRETADADEWDVFDARTSSTNSTFLMAWPSRAPADIATYSTWVEAAWASGHVISTNMICVADHALPGFLAAAENSVPARR